MRTRAAVMWASGSPLDVRMIDVDGPGPGEVRVRMAASGICHSDLHTLDGTQDYPAPAVLGHEGAGIVESLGEGVTQLEVGDHVLLSWVPSCGQCRSCSTGHPNLCDDLDWSDNGTMRDGTVRFHAEDSAIHHYTISSFAEHSVVPASSCIPVDKGLPLEDLALLGCAVMTGVGAVVNTAQVRAGDTVAVIGCGGVGLNAIQGAVLAGASQIIAVDISTQALELARDVGATDLVDSSKPDPAGVIRKLSRGGVDHAFEILGLKETIELANAVTCKRGQTILIGMAAEDTRPQFDALSLTVEEKSIRGCWYGQCRPTDDFPRLVDFYRRGMIRLQGLTRHIPLEDVNVAFDELRRGVPGRSVIVY